MSESSDRKMTSLDKTMSQLSKTKEKEKTKSAERKPKGHKSSIEDSDDEEDTDDFGGLMDEALWEIFSGNLPVSKLTPSPAKDRVRLALSAMSSKEKLDHESARKSVEAKEYTMNQTRKLSVRKSK